MAVGFTTTYAISAYHHYTLENRIVALEKIVENLEDRIKNGTNSSKEGLFDCLFV
jgi:hypothetical protein